MSDFGLKNAEVKFFDGNKQEFLIEELQRKIDLVNLKYSGLSLIFPELSQDVVT